MSDETRGRLSGLAEKWSREATSADSDRAILLRQRADAARRGKLLLRRAEAADYGWCVDTQGLVADADRLGLIEESD